MPWRLLVEHAPTIVDAARRLYAGSLRPRGRYAPSERSTQSLESLQRAIEQLEARVGRSQGPFCLGLAQARIRSDVSEGRAEKREAKNTNQKNDDGVYGDDFPAHEVVVSGLRRRPFGRGRMALFSC